MHDAAPAGNAEIVSEANQTHSWALAPFDAMHVPDMFDLWVASWSEAMPDIDFEARRSWFSSHLTALRENDHHIVLGLDRASGTLGGFVTIAPDTNQLDQLVVAVRHKGKGLADALLKAARTLSPERLVLEVNVGNPRARAFYARQGFVETARSRNALSGRETAVLEWRRQPDK